MSGREEYPYRLVDRLGHGWLRQRDGVYTTYPLVLWPEGLPIDRLVAERGGWVPVGEPPQADLDQMFLELHGCGTRALGTALAAVTEVAKALLPVDGGTQRLVAGRPKSWESERLVDLVWYVGVDIKPERVVAGAKDVVAAILSRWIHPGPDGEHVEVAENLAGVLGRVVDMAGGYRDMADQWLRQHNRMGGCTGVPYCTCRVEPLRLYVVSQSRRHYPGVDATRLGELLTAAGMVVLHGIGPDPDATVQVRDGGDAIRLSWDDDTPDQDGQAERAVAALRDSPYAGHLELVTDGEGHPVVVVPKLLER